MYSIGDIVILRNCQSYNISRNYNDKTAAINRFYTTLELIDQGYHQVNYNCIVRVLEDNTLWHINTKDLIRQARILKII